MTTKIYDTTKPYKKSILGAIRTTWDSPYVQVSQTGPYPLIRRTLRRAEVDHTDGIGTKGVLHWKYRTWDAAVQDSLAMNLNDLLCVWARPYKLQNHLAVPSDDHEAIRDIIEALCRRCAALKIAVTGGETSVMDTATGMDLTCTVSGFVVNERDSTFNTGDALIGLRSSGCHSNGYTLVRSVLKDPGVEFTTPTEIYWDRVYPHLNAINGVVHVAGGGFSRVREVLSDGQCAEMAWHCYDAHHHLLWKAIKNNQTMYKTFNCGIGMVLAVNPAEADAVRAAVDGVHLGSIVAGPTAVRIQSAFDGDEVVL